MTAETGSSSVRVRYAPSPTGRWHLGSARTALFNWLFARREKGVFIVRIEDTDKTRSKQEFETDIFEGLSWLGLEWDEGPSWRKINGEEVAGRGQHGPYRQSERTPLYRKNLEALLAAGRAYYCYCTQDELEAERQAYTAEGLPPRYSGHCRDRTVAPAGKEPQTIRFKTPETNVEFKDIVRGTVSFDTTLFGDIVIAKDLDTPLYNFTAAVDDELMEITHVIRGEDHISNTPKQILFQHALGFRTPIYAHIPLILNPDRSKMSKRHADTSTLHYKDAGYLPEALDNFLAFLGWHPKDNAEIFSLDELAAQFDLRRVQKAGAVFILDKLEWLNKEHIRRLSTDDLAARIAPYMVERFGKQAATTEFLERFIALDRDRLTTLSDAPVHAEFLFALPTYEPSLLAWRDTPRATTKEILLHARDAIAALSSESKLNKEGIIAALEPLIADHGRGNVLWPVRVALSGQKASPDPIAIAEILGRDETLRRLNLAITLLS